MTYKRYEKYKDSGIEWIGEIPEGWKVSKIKHIKSKEKNSFVDGPFGSNLKSEHFVEDGEAYVIESNFATRGVLNTEILKKITNEHFETIKRSEVRGGDIVIAKIGEYFGLSNILPNIDRRAVISGNSLKLTVDKDVVNREYLHYELLELKQNGVINLLSNSTAQPALSLGVMNNLDILIPSLNEQKQIANFLDKKTSEIDALVSEKEKLIELLKEKRQAIIAEAVTKGLNPNVKMKDSGVQWIGEMPEHWTISKIKYLANLKSGETIKSENINPEGDHPVYGGNGLRGYTDLYTHHGEYILVGRQGHLCGNINYANGRFWASEHAVVVTVNFNINLLWFGELLRSMNLNQYSISAAQPGLSVYTIQNLVIPVPPSEEQNKIASFIKYKISDIEVLIKNIYEDINKLKQYKQSLISEAVTGKIDVSELV